MTWTGLLLQIYGNSFDAEYTTLKAGIIKGNFATAINNAGVVQCYKVARVERRSSLLVSARAGETLMVNTGSDSADTTATAILLTNKYSKIISAWYTFDGSYCTIYLVFDPYPNNITVTSLYGGESYSPTYYGTNPPSNAVNIPIDIPVKENQSASLANATIAGALTVKGGISGNLTGNVNSNILKAGANNDFEYNDNDPSNASTQVQFSADSSAYGFYSYLINNNINEATLLNGLYGAVPFCYTQLYVYIKDSYAVRFLNKDRQQVGETNLSLAKDWLNLPQTIILNKYTSGGKSYLMKKLPTNEPSIKGALWVDSAGYVRVKR